MCKENLEKTKNEPFPTHHPTIAQEITPGSH